LGVLKPLLVFGPFNIAFKFFRFREILFRVLLEGLQAVFIKPDAGAFVFLRSEILEGLFLKFSDFGFQPFFLGCDLILLRELLVFRGLRFFGPGNRNQQEQRDKAYKYT
jgi:hypothetical protein